MSALCPMRLPACVHAALRAVRRVLPVFKVLVSLHTQALILTKGLGTGTIMAAAMRGRAEALWLSGGLRHDPHERLRVLAAALVSTPGSHEP
jgi:hypothetical protein